MASSLQELFAQPKISLSELSLQQEAIPDAASEAASGAISKKPEKLKVLSIAELQLREECTVFVGNLPIKAPQWEIKKFFSSCGPIEAVRIRSVPTLESRLPKKAAVITKQYSNVKDSVNAYVVFKSKDAVPKALALNGALFMERHVRVDTADDSKHDYKNTIFVGNIPYTVYEEELWQKFSEFGKIVNVRIVRDNKTQKPKGIAYIMFSEKDERKKATVAKVIIGTRELRIKKAASKYKQEKKEKIRDDKAKVYAEKRRPKPEVTEKKEDTAAPKKKDKKREEARKERKIRRKMLKTRKEAPPQQMTKNKKGKFD